MTYSKDGTLAKRETERAAHVADDDHWHQGSREIGVGGRQESYEGATTERKMASRLYPRYIVDSFFNAPLAEQTKGLMSSAEG